MTELYQHTPFKGSIEEKAYKYSDSTYGQESAPAIDGYMAGYRQAQKDMKPQENWDKRETPGPLGSM